MTLTGENKINVVKRGLLHYYEIAAASFKDRPSADNYSNLESAMLAYQASFGSDFGSTAIMLYDSIGIGNWVDTVAAEVRDALSSMNNATNTQRKGRS